MGDWWNGVELWVLGLPFYLQFTLVMAVLMPICVVVAWAIDRAVDYISARLRPSADPEPPLGAE